MVSLTSGRTLWFSSLHLHFIAVGAGLPTVLSLRSGRNLWFSSLHLHFVAVGAGLPTVLSLRSGRTLWFSSLHLHFVAVGAGFEPAVQLPVRQFSKLLVSASHPSHQVLRTDGKSSNSFCNEKILCVFF